MPRLVSGALAAVCALACLAACGDDGGSVADAGTDAATDAPIDAALDAPTGPLTLTSTVLAEGATFPADYTCNGVNESPPLAWINTPPGTQSLAVVMTDTTINLIHWVIYDIPAPRAGLPEDVDKTYAPEDVPGAHQAKSFNAQVTGYLGPCPPQRHDYRFTLYALDVAVLPGTSETTTRTVLQALLNDHDVATATLAGSYAQP
jgi:Raf kinase inhibitor-like YbhB/YbcL family protein